jgi:multidrug efflux pump subunit AcrA (membrane-fusion protein)
MENNNLNINKKKLRKMLYIYIAIILALILSSRTIYNFTLPRVTVAMPQSGRITKELEARGVIGFSDTFEIYATSSGQINEMLIRRGDLIDENTIIATFKEGTTGAGTNTAELSFSIDRIENQLSGLALNRAAIQDRLRALNTESSGDFNSLQWAVFDAMTTVEKRQDELLEAQRHMEIPFHSHTPVQATTDFELDWNRRVAELKNAEAALLSAEANDLIFDDFIYQRNINEAGISLDRRKTDLEEAEDALATARRDRSSTFDNSTYQNAVNTARTTHDRSIEDYNEALRQLDLAWWNYSLAVTSGQALEIAAAQSVVDNVQNLVTTSRRAVEDANTTLNQAIENMRKAENTFNTNRDEARQQTITEVETRVRQVGLAVEDAERVYENAVNELNRARDLFNADTEESRLNAVQEAEKRIEAAISAINEFERNASQNLSEAETNLANAQTALERAEINLESAQITSATQTNEVRNSLDLDLRRADLDIARTNIDLREMEAKLAADTDTADIRADYQGIVISVDKNRGQFVSQGERIATAGINNNLFITEITVSYSDGRFIELGDEARIIKSGSSSTITAMVYDIMPIGDTLKISLICETDEFNGGEYVTIRFQKQTQIFHAIVPNEAIFNEGMGNFVWVVQSRQGALGIEYFTTRVRVLIADSDDFHSAISRGLEFVAPVVISHDRDLTVNGRVSRME